MPQSVIIFNKTLLEMQQVKPEQRENLLTLHTMLDNIFNWCKRVDSVQLVLNRALINDTIRDLEFAFQDNWNFPRNSTKHWWWFKNPSCACPKNDNYDRFGDIQCAINNACPLHGTATAHQSTITSSDGTMEWEVYVMSDKSTITWSAHSKTGPSFSGKLCRHEHTVNRALHECALAIRKWGQND